MMSFETWEVVLLKLIMLHGRKDFKECGLSHRLIPLVICCIFCLTYDNLMMNYVSDSLVWILVHASDLVCFVIRHGI